MGHLAVSLHIFKQIDLDFHASVVHIIEVTFGEREKKTIRIAI